MKILKLENNKLYFTNGDVISYDHEQDCCEHNYADFEQLDDLAYTIEFNTPLEFEAVDNAGFRFGNKGNMVFVPCYSEQNGYYSSWVDIYYNGEKVLFVDAEVYGSYYDDYDDDDYEEENELEGDGGTPEEEPPIEPKDLTMLTRQMKNIDKIVSKYTHIQKQICDMQIKLSALKEIEGSMLDTLIKEFCENPTSEIQSKLEQYCKDTLCKFDLEISTLFSTTTLRVLTPYCSSYNGSFSLLHLYLPRYDLLAEIERTQRQLNYYANEMEELIGLFYTDKVSESDFNIFRYI